jgi:hypothetical protein
MPAPAAEPSPKRDAERAALRAELADRRATVAAFTADAAPSPDPHRRSRARRGTVAAGPSTANTPSSGRQLQRRGMLAGVAALVAGALAKTAEPSRVEAGHDTTTAPTATNVLHLGVVNDGGNAASDESATNITTRTVLVGNVAGPVFRVRQNNSAAGTSSVETQSVGFGVRAVSTGAGTEASTNALHGEATGGGRGVFGQTGGGGAPIVGASAGVLGILGDNPSINTPAAVLGISHTNLCSSGVHGIATNGTDVSVVTVCGVGVQGDGVGAGVVGNGLGTEGSQGFGVSGRTNSTDAAAVIGRNAGTGPGVRGFSANNGNGPGIGLDGQSGSGDGVQGRSSSGVGVRGTAATNHGVFGQTSAPRAPWLMACSRRA